MRPSGTIVEVAPDGSSLVVEEMVAWRDPGTGVVTRSIWITPQTSIRLVERRGAAVTLPVVRPEA